MLLQLIEVCGFLETFSGHKLTLGFNLALPWLKNSRLTVTSYYSVSRCIVKWISVMLSLVLLPTLLTLSALRHPIIYHQLATLDNKQRSSLPGAITLIVFYIIFLLLFFGTSGVQYMIHAHCLYRQLSSPVIVPTDEAGSKGSSSLPSISRFPHAS